MHAIPKLLAASLAALPLLGPPLVCFPWRIGDAPSLPWGNDAFELGNLDPDELQSATAKALDATKDPLVHMETLRRAAVYATRFDERAKKGEGREASQLVSMMNGRTLRSLCEGKDEALAWLDVGYLRESLGQLGSGKANAGRDFLEKAASLAPNDPAIRLAACGASLDSHGGKEKALAHLDAALSLAKPGSPVHENAVAYAKHFFGRDEGLSKKAGE
ncbi:MAG TPA: hypothetical protein VKE69_06600 [Planctomycetota bacterium]|nr:hypothetical protein [Planctomycetota bacterium]